MSEPNLDKQIAEIIEGCIPSFKGQVVLKPSAGAEAILELIKVREREAVVGDDKYLVGHRVFSEYLATAKTPEDRVYISNYLEWLATKLKTRQQEVKDSIS